MYKVPYNSVIPDEELHKHRRELDKVKRAPGSSDGLEPGSAKHGVERVPSFVKERLDFRH